MEWDGWLVRMVMACAVVETEAQCGRKGWAPGLCDGAWIGCCAAVAVYMVAGAGDARYGVAVAGAADMAGFAVW